MSLSLLGEILEVRPARVDWLRGVREARQLRAADEEYLREILTEVVPDLGPLGGLEAYDDVRVHAQRLRQLLLRHEDPLPRGGQVRPVYLHSHTLSITLSLIPPSYPRCTPRFTPACSPLVRPVILRARLCDGCCDHRPGVVTGREDHGREKNSGCEGARAPGRSARRPGRRPRVGGR